jgi:hypothetical protein
MVGNTEQHGELGGLLLGQLLLHSLAIPGATGSLRIRLLRAPY